MNKKGLFLVMLLGLLLFTANVYGAGQTEGAKETYPVKEITLVIQFDAGGTTDLPARTVVEYVNKYLPHNINCINIVGAAGVTGALEVIDANPDGYTLIVGPPAYAIQNALGKGVVTYEDFRPLFGFAEAFNTLLVRGDSQYKTFKDYVNAAKDNPNKVTLGASYNSMPHFSALAIQKQEAVSFRMVDIAAAGKIVELQSGRIEAYIDAFASVRSFIKEGEFRALGVFAPQRVPGFDNIPTFNEMGYGMPFLRTIFGIWAPKGTPDYVVDVLEEAFKKATSDPALQEKALAMGFMTNFIDNNAYLEMLPKYYAGMKEFGQAAMKK